MESRRVIYLGSLGSGFFPDEYKELKKVIEYGLDEEGMEGTIDALLEGGHIKELLPMDLDGDREPAYRPGWTAVDLRAEAPTGDARGGMTISYTFVNEAVTWNVAGVTTP
jgi:hypothetical protein